MAPRAAVCGAGGFIGSHMVRRLKAEGWWVLGVDTHLPNFSQTAADDFALCDLRDRRACRDALAGSFDELYQFAADAGGAGDAHDDAAVMRNCANINLNVLDVCLRGGCGKILFPSAVGILPGRSRRDPAMPLVARDAGHLPCPGSGHAWEKLFAECLYLAHARTEGLDVRIARYHGVFGPEGPWCGGQESLPAMVCRKVAMAEDGGAIDVWGDGSQLCSFLYVDECCEGTWRLMRSDVTGPIAIGPANAMTLSQLVDCVVAIAGKRIRRRHVPGLTGVLGLTDALGMHRIQGLADAPQMPAGQGMAEGQGPEAAEASEGKPNGNPMWERLGWKPSLPLTEGLERTYAWVEAQVAAAQEGTPKPKGAAQVTEPGQPRRRPCHAADSAAPRTPGR